MGITAHTGRAAQTPQIKKRMKINNCDAVLPVPCNQGWIQEQKHSECHSSEMQNKSRVRCSLHKVLKRLCSHMEQFRSWSESTTVAEGTWRTEENITFYSEHIFFALFFTTGKWQTLRCQKVSSIAGQAVPSLHRCQSNKITVSLTWHNNWSCCVFAVVTSCGLQVTRRLAKKCPEKHKHTWAKANCLWEFARNGQLVIQVRN